MAYFPVEENKHNFKMKNQELPLVSLT